MGLIYILYSFSIPLYMFLHIIFVCLYSIELISIISHVQFSATVLIGIPVYILYFACNFSHTIVKMFVLYHQFSIILRVGVSLHYIMFCIHFVGYYLFTLFVWGNLSYSVEKLAQSEQILGILQGYLPPVGNCSLSNLFHQQV